MKTLALIIGALGLVCFVAETYFTRRGRNNKIRKFLLWLIGAVLMISAGYLIINN